MFQSPDLLKRLADSDAFANPSAYLAAVVYNTAVDWLREESRHARRNPPLSNPQDLPDRHSPQMDLERLESAAELRDLLERVLAPADWDLLRWRFWESRSLQEIATALGVPYHAAAMRLHRLQKQLMDLLSAR
jgi:RNA polymerase sigma factor (sigma-70 family)